MIISLLQKKNETEYASTITKLLGNEAINQWLKNPREGQYCIVVFESTHFQGKKEVMIYQEKGMAVCGGAYGLVTWSMWSSLRPTEVEC